MGDSAALTERHLAKLRPPSNRNRLMLVACAFACRLHAETLQLVIPALSLERALLELTAKTGIELIYPAELVNDLSSQAISGRYEPEQALTELLNQSGLGFRRISPQAFTLFRIQTSDNDLPLATLDTLVVRGQAIRDSAATGEMRYGNAASSSATGSNTALRSIPQSVEIIDRNLLQDQQTVQLSDSLLNVSGVIPRNPQFSPVTEGTMLRGFRTEQLLDGFNQYYNAGDRESWINVERIEVLKGPNGLLYGGGAGSTASGSLYLFSKQPHDRAHYSAGFKGGSYDFFQPYFDINQPLNDSVWFRMTGEYTHAHSFIDALDTQRFSLNPTLALNLGEAHRLTLYGKLSDWRSPEYQGIPATGTLAGDFRLPDSTFIGPADIPDSRARTHAVWATLDSRINPLWSMTWQARYAASSQRERTQNLIGDGFSLVADRPYLAPSTWLLANAALSDRMDELNFRGSGLAEFDWASSHHRVTIGGDYSRMDDSGYLQFSPAGAIDLATGAFDIPYREPDTTNGDHHSTSQVYGGYLQWHADLFERLHPLLGVRLNTVDIDYTDPDDRSNYLTRSTRWLPRAGLSIDINDWLSLFGGYSTGMRGQPFLIFADQPRPELSSQWESGIKFELNRQLTGQFAVYRIEREQAPVAADPFGTAYRAAGWQQSEGFEADLKWQPLAGLNLLANYAVCDARFLDSHDLIQAGNRLPWVPEHSGRFWLHYRFDESWLKGLDLGFGLYASSGAYLSNDNRFKTGSYHTFDASIGYQTGPVKWSATVKNLSNEHYYLPFTYLGLGAGGGGRVSPAAGTTLYLNASFEFGE